MKASSRATGDSGAPLDWRQSSLLALFWAIAALGVGCAHTDRAVTIDPPFVVSAAPLRIVSANDGDALRSLGRPGSDLPDSISVIDLSADAPPLLRTVSGTVASTFNGAPYLAMVSAGRYALIPNHGWGSDEVGQPSPSQVSVVDLDTPDLTVVATLPLPEHAWQVQALPDGDRAIALSNHQFHLVELVSGQPRIISQSEPFASYMFSFAISPDGRSIIVTAAEELALSTAVELHLFVVENDTIRHQARIGVDPAVGQIDQPFAPRFSPDGSLLFVQVSAAHHIDVYTVDGTKLVRSPCVLRTGEGPASMALSPR